MYRKCQVKVELGAEGVLVKISEFPDVDLLSDHNAVWTEDIFTVNETFKTE